MTNILRWRGLWVWSSIAAIILGAGVVVAHRFYAHATPERALAAQQFPLTGIVRSIPFAQGELVISKMGQNGGFNGWYLTQNLWGWHVGTLSMAYSHLAPSEFPSSYAAIYANGRTMLWGVTERPMKTVILSWDHRPFLAAAGAEGFWHMTVPGSVHVVYNRQWSMMLPNGKIVPMYPPA